MPRQVRSRVDFARKQVIEKRLESFDIGKEDLFGFKNIRALVKGLEKSLEALSRINELRKN
jgi:hypothetical protein